MVGGGIPLLFTDQLPINIYRQFVTFSQTNLHFTDQFSGSVLSPPPIPKYTPYHPPPPRMQMRCPWHSTAHVSCVCAL